LVEFSKLVKIGGFRSNTLKVSDFIIYEITYFVCLARRAFFFFEKKESKKTLSVPHRRSEMILCKILVLVF
jgi:hypothetical protein